MASQVYLCVKGNRPEAEQIVGVAIAQRIQWARRVQLSPCTTPPQPAQYQRSQISSNSRSSKQSPSSHSQADCPGVSAPQPMRSPPQLPLQPLPLNAASPPDRSRNHERSASVQHCSPLRAAEANVAPPVDTHETPMVQGIASRSDKHSLSSSHIPVSAGSRPVNSLRRWLRPPATQATMASSAISHKPAEPVNRSTSAAEEPPDLNSKLVVSHSGPAMPLQERNGMARCSPAGIAGGTVSACQTASAATASILTQARDNISGPQDSTPSPQHLPSLQNAAYCASHAAARQEDQSAVQASVPESLATAQNSSVSHELAPAGSHHNQASGNSRRRFAVEGRGQPERVVCGVRVIWVSRDSRRCGIAGRLLDAVR